MPTIHCIHITILFFWCFVIQFFSLRLNFCVYKCYPWNRLFSNFSFHLDLYHIHTIDMKDDRFDEKCLLFFLNILSCDFDLNFDKLPPSWICLAKFCKFITCPMSLKILFTYAWYNLMTHNFICDVFITFNLCHYHFEIN